MKVYKDVGIERTLSGVALLHDFVRNKDGVSDAW